MWLNRAQEKGDERARSLSRKSTVADSHLPVGLIPTSQCRPYYTRTLAWTSL